MDKTFGQVAYEKAQELGSPRYPLTWEELPQGSKDYWEAIVLAVIEYFDIHLD